MTRIFAAATTVLAIISAGLAAGPTSQPGEQPGVLLDGRSSWRCFTQLRTEVLHNADGQVRSVRVRGQRGVLPPPATQEQTADPPADWTAADFDDSGWARYVGPVPSGSLELAVQCIRGKFIIADPAKISSLTLNLGYRGGAVVYLNGQEVGRNHLPAGRLNAETLAERYPPEAYLRPDNTLLQNGFGDPNTYKDRFASRTRRLDNVAIRGKLLRKGVNVLAIELHRSATAEVLLTGRSMNGAPAMYCMWSQLGLEQVSLAAPPECTPTAVQPNVTAPPSVRLFTHDVTQKLTVTDWPDPTERLGPVRIAGTRNGSFSGIVVMTNDKPLHAPVVTVGKLKQSAGGGTIPSVAVIVRYGVPDGAAYGTTPWFEGVEESVPVDVPLNRGNRATLPIWLTVHIPADAPAGEYLGKATVAAEGVAPMDVPVKLTVAGWTMPDTKAFVSHVGVFQSPDSLALQYSVEQWSAEHWRLVEKSLELLGRLGEDDVYLPLICDTYIGNSQTMVRQVKQADGSYKPDFSIAEKYLDLAIKHLGKPPVVCLYIWDGQGGFWGPTGRDLGAQKENAMVTSVEADGKLGRTPAPKWGEPECVPFWKPVFDGLADRLKARGLDSSMMVGVAMDNRPLKITVDELATLAPKARWVLHSHMSVGGAIGKVEQVGYGAHVWVSYRLVDPDRLKTPVYGWQHPYIFTAFPRYGAGGVGAIRVGGQNSYRLIEESLLACGHRGVGRIGADFWDVVKDKSGRVRNVLGNVSVTLMDSTPYILMPGKMGPIASVRFEMLREGVQEAEARIFIEKALVDGALRAKLGEELATACRQLLDGRVRLMLRAMGGSDSSGPTNWTLMQTLGVQDQSRQLFELAGRVAQRVDR